jgi:hypothetical protein
VKREAEEEEVNIPVQLATRQSIGLDQQQSFPCQDREPARARPANGAVTPIFARRRRWRFALGQTVELQPDDVRHHQRLDPAVSAFGQTGHRADIAE